jgi:hypothetical protein
VLASVITGAYDRASFSICNRGSYGIVRSVREKNHLSVRNHRVIEYGKRRAKQEVAALQQEKSVASEQKKAFEEKITGLLKQFESESNAA